MTKKNMILIAGGISVFILIIVILVVRANLRNKTVFNNTSGTAAVSASQNPADNIPANISWSFQSNVVTDQNSNDVTSNNITVVVNGQNFDLGLYPGKSEEIKDYAAYDMPADTLSACKSVLLTGGDYFYIVRKDNTTLTVMTRFMDDAIQKADNTKTKYNQKMEIKIPQPSGQQSNQSSPQPKVTP